MTVREQLVAWGLTPDDLLNADLRAQDVPVTRGAVVQAYANAREMVVEVRAPIDADGPLGEKHARERAKLAQRQAAERGATPGQGMGW